MKPRDLPRKISIIYNTVDETKGIVPVDKKVADEDTRKMAEDIAGTLKNNFEIDLFEVPVNDPGRAAEVNCDLVFNLCEGTGYEFSSEVIDTLEKNQIPYVGANALNYRIGSDKALLKEFLQKTNIPTPRGQFFVKADETLDPGINFPLLIKPVYEHGSVGITMDSVVTNESSLRRQLSKILNTYSEAAIAEEYIEGRELQLTLVGNGDTLRMLPIKEILFVNGISKKWHIVTFSAKWDKTSEEYKATPTVCPAENISQDEYKLFETLGKDVFIKSDCQDYTRIDIRYNQGSGKPYVLDVNPNPDLSSDAAVAVAAAAYGWSYEQLLKEIIIASWERSGGFSSKHQLKNKTINALQSANL